VEGGGGGGEGEGGEEREEEVSISSNGLCVFAYLSSFLLQTNHCSQSLLLVVSSVPRMVSSVYAQTNHIIGNVNTVIDHWCNFIHSVLH
jgi:hypothetical protein